MPNHTQSFVKSEYFGDDVDVDDIIKQEPFDDSIVDEERYEFQDQHSFEDNSTNGEYEDVPSTSRSNEKRSPRIAARHYNQASGKRASKRLFNSSSDEFKDQNETHTFCNSDSSEEDVLLSPMKKNKLTKFDPDLKRLENAKRTIRRYGQGDTRKLSFRDWKRLSWARKFVTRMEAESNHPNVSELTEIITQTDNKIYQSSSNSKNTKQGTSFELKDKKNLEVAIVIAGNPIKRLSDTQWTQLEEVLLDRLHSKLVTFTDFFPSFGAMSTVNGFNILTCLDEYTLFWLKAKITEMKDFVQGATLKVVSKYELPTRPRARINIRGPGMTKERLELFLRTLNPDFPSDDWQVLELGTPTKTGQTAIIILNDETIDMLPSREYMLCIGITKVKVQPLPVAYLLKKEENDDVSVTV